MEKKHGKGKALTVLASALGPLLLATCVAWTGSYRAMFYILAAVIGMFGLAARHDVHARFAAPTIVEQIERVYRSLVLPQAA